MSGESSPPRSGWYPDPEQAGQDRWWNGSGWSDRRRPSAELPESEPVSGPAAEPDPPAEAGPEPTSTRREPVVVLDPLPTSRPSVGPLTPRPHPFSAESMDRDPSPVTDGPGALGPETRNLLARTGLLLAVAGFVINVLGLVSLAGAVLSIAGLRRGQRLAAIGAYSPGRTAAVAGIVVGIAGFIAGVAVWVVVIGIVSLAWSGPGGE